MSAQHTHDFWAYRFEAARPHDAGAGLAMYRRCIRCGGHALEGALSAHARRCDQQHSALTLKAFDDLGREDRRALRDQLADVRARAKEAL